MEKQRPQPDRPTTIVRQFLGDPHIRERLVNPQGDFFVRNKAKKVISGLDKKEVKVLKKNLNEIILFEKPKGISEGAHILMEHIPSTKGRPFSPEVSQRRRRIKKYIQEGKTAKEIAEKEHRSIRTIEKDIKSLRGQKEKPVSSKITKRRERILRLYEQNKTFKQIAAIENCSFKTVTRDIEWLRNNGENIPFHKNKLTSQLLERRKLVRKLNAQGLTPKQIAEEMNKPRQQIRDDLYVMRKKGEL